jgi:hypothetical protein
MNLSLPLFENSRTYGSNATDSKYSPNVQRISRGEKKFNPG